MVQMNFSPMMVTEVKRKQDELIREFELLRMANEAKQSRTPKRQAPSKLLAKVGKELVSLGTGLEHRFGILDNPDDYVNQQRSAGNCT